MSVLVCIMSNGKSSCVFIFTFNIVNIHEERIDEFTLLVICIGNMKVLDGIKYVSSS